VPGALVPAEFTLLRHRPNPDPHARRKEELYADPYY
jgi:hypothetical protein